MAIALSRFALLKIEDDFDSDEEKQSKQGGKDNNQQKSKKNKKKNKKTGGQTDTAELKSMAFGGAKPAKKPPAHNGHSQQPATAAKVPVKQWEEWKKLDAENTGDSYEKDLQQALLMSRLEQEEHKEKDPGEEASATSENGASKKKKKNKKKNKKEKAPMTLEEFNQLQREKKPEETDGPEYEVMPKAAKVNTTLPKDAQPDKQYFSKVEKDVQKIIRQEHIQEEYRKQYASGSVVNAQHQRELEKRDEEIIQLRKDNKGLTDIMCLFQEEFQQIKHRNQQLNHLLAQGQMKQKAELQVQLDQLQQTHQELTEQLTSLTTDHEKEKSKNHALMAENLKLKANKHK